MKGLKSVAKQSKKASQDNWSSYIPLYYSIEKDTVRTTQAAGYHFVTNLIRENTEEESREAVRRFLWM